MGSFFFRLCAFTNDLFTQAQNNNHKQNLLGTLAEWLSLSNAISIYFNLIYMQLTRTRPECDRPHTYTHTQIEQIRMRKMKKKKKQIKSNEEEKYNQCEKKVGVISSNPLATFVGALDICM